MPAVRTWFSLGVAVLLGLAVTGVVRAQPLARVVRTLGDASEATCVEAEPGSDVLWIGTLGAGVFRVRSGAAPERFDAARGLAGHRVRDCLVHGGVTWVATEAGVSRFEPGVQRFSTALRGRYLRLAAAGAALYAARGDGVVQRIEAGVVTQLAATGSVPLALAASTGGRWALGGVDGAIFVGSGAGGQRVSRGDRAHVPREPIEQIAFEGDAVVATTASRVLRVDALAPASGARRLASVTERASVAPRPDARAGGAGAELHGLLVHDRVAFGAGEAIATDAGVFVRARPGEALRALALDGQPCGDRISALAVQGEALWIGSFDRGLCRLDARGFTHFRGPEYLPSDMVNALATDESSLYVATAQGLAVVDAGGAFQSFTHAQCIGRLDAPCPWHLAVNGVAVDPVTRHVWVADFGAVHRIDAGTRGWQRPRLPGVTPHALTRIAAFGGEVAIGTGDRGLYVLREGSVRAIDDQAGLADNWVMDVAYDAQGRLWTATCTRGVSVRDARGRFRTLTTRDGLPDDYALSVQEIAGRIWIGTLGGLAILDAGRITTLTVHDGLSGNEVHDAVAYAGAVWVATDGGLSVVEIAPPKPSVAPLYSSGPR